MEPRQTLREEHIRVDRQIVNLLSLATYESFPRVVRELISNSYDADATRVSIDVDLSANSIQIKDDGNGMNPEQLRYFLTIAARTRTQRRSPRYQRERIGQFGVGFLAAFPFCDEMSIETSASSSPVVTTAIIPCAKYLKDRPIGPEVSPDPVEQIPVPVSEIIDPRRTTRHYTSVLLRGLTPVARAYFGDDHTSGSKRSVRAMPAMERLKWDLQDTVVLDYPPESVVAESLRQQPVGMEVFFNGDRMFRNTPPGEVLESHKTSGKPRGAEIGGLRVRYVITSPWEPVHPHELRGLRIHVDNVGVGPRESFGLAVHAGALPRLSWLSGDIYIDEGGKEFLALNREGFTNAPKIQELCDFFRERLRDVDEQLSTVDTKLKEVEHELGLRVRGGGPRPSLPVGSKKQNVESRVRQLATEAGFKIERVSPADLRTSPVQTPRLLPDPVEIDRLSKVIRIYEEHPEFRDTLVTSLGEFSLEFDRWNHLTSPYPACEPRGQRGFLVNLDYPPFGSKRYGRLLLRAATTLTMLANESPTTRALAQQVLVAWAEEFRDLLD